jgi:hypothetical protein
MKASIGNLAADITTSLERVNVDDIDYEIHQAEIP